MCGPLRSPLASLLRKLFHFERDRVVSYATCVVRCANSESAVHGPGQPLGVCRREAKKRYKRGPTRVATGLGSGREKSFLCCSARVEPTQVQPPLDLLVIDQAPQSIATSDGGALGLCAPRARTHVAALQAKAVLADEAATLKTLEQRLGRSSCGCCGLALPWRGSELRKGS